MSRFHIKRNVEKMKIRGTAENTARLTLHLEPFSEGDTVNIELDGYPSLTIPVDADKTVTLGRSSTGWKLTGKLSADQKGPHHYGAFKEAFTNRMLFVYGTSGTEKENSLAYEKARYDAETWYYRGNGAVDLIADREFDPAQHQDRNVIIYGNRDVNSAWEVLLQASPIQISRHCITLDSYRFEGEDLAAYFLYPRPDSDTGKYCCYCRNRYGWNKGGYR